MKRLALLLAAVVSLAGQAAHAVVIEYAIAPEAKSRAELWPTLVETLLAAKATDVITVVDVQKNQRIATISIPEEVARVANPVARSNWLTKQPVIAKLKGFLKEPDTTVGQGSGVAFVRYIRSLELRRAEFNQPVQAVYWGSPIVVAPGVSLAAAWPADGFLFATDAFSLFSVTGKEGALKDVTLHLVHSATLAEFAKANPDGHRDRLRRFYGLFVGLQGGNLATFASSAEHLRNLAVTAYPKIDYGRPDNSSNKLLLWDVLAPVADREGKALRTSLWQSPAPAKNPSLSASQLAASPLDIGIRWWSNKNERIDLDIYVQAAPGDAELSYKQTGAPEKYAGRFLRDITAAGDENGFETVTYAGNVPVKGLKAYINHYSGKSSTPVAIEVRVRVQGEIYSKRLQLPAGMGTGGGGNRDASPSWVKIDVPALLGL